MSNAPISPPNRLPPAPPYGRNEDDWIVLIEFLPKSDVEDRTQAAERIGYMLAYAQMTDTRMLSLLGDPDTDAYELLFSFSSARNKAEFLRLLNSNEVSACDDGFIRIPLQGEIDAAQPIGKVLPEDVLQRVTLVATMLTDGHTGVVQ